MFFFMVKFDKILMSEIKLSDYNPRRISPEEVQHLKNSIKQFGFVSPIIINLRNNRIIGGHQRYKVLLDEGVEELFLLKLGDIGWCFSDNDLKIDDDVGEKALNLALNKIKGEWDEYKLNNILEELSLDGLDISLTGFERQDISDDFIDLKNNDDSSSFFDNEVGLYDSIEDISNDEIVVKQGNAILKMGVYTIELNTPTLKKWIVNIERECNFETDKVVNEIQRRLGI